MRHIRSQNKARSVLRTAATSMAILEEKRLPLLVWNKSSDSVRNELKNSKVYMSSKRDPWLPHKKENHTKLPATVPI